jgi:hypothetical protein
MFIPAAEPASPPERYDDYDLRRVATEISTHLQGIRQTSEVNVSGGRPPTPPPSTTIVFILVLLTGRSRLPAFIIGGDCPEYGRARSLHKALLIKIFVI